MNAHGLGWDVLLGVAVAAVLAFVAIRVVHDSAPWLGRWTYELTDDALIVRVVSQLGLPIAPTRVSFDEIDRVERTAGPAVGGTTLPWRLGRKTVLGSLGTANTVDIVRRGWRAPVVITPPEPDAFARDLRMALANYHAERGAARRGPWYTRQS